MLDGRFSDYGKDAIIMSAAGGKRTDVEAMWLTDLGWQLIRRQAFESCAMCLLRWSRRCCWLSATWEPALACSWLRSLQSRAVATTCRVIHSAEDLVGNRSVRLPV
jgi:hypothetical protein